MKLKIKAIIALIGLWCVTASTALNSNNNLNDDGNNRSRRGVSVDGGGNLREQLDTSLDEIRLLRNKLLRLEDELNNSVLVNQKKLILCYLS